MVKKIYLYRPHAQGEGCTMYEVEYINTRDSYFGNIEQTNEKWAIASEA